MRAQLLEEQSLRCAETLEEQSLRNAAERELVDEQLRRQELEDEIDILTGSPLPPLGQDFSESQPARARPTRMSMTILGGSVALGEFQDVWKHLPDTRRLARQIMSERMEASKKIEALQKELEKQKKESAKELRMVKAKVLQEQNKRVLADILRTNAQELADKLYEQAAAEARAAIEAGERAATDKEFVEIVSEQRDKDAEASRVQVQIKSFW